MIYEKDMIQRTTDYISYIVEADNAFDLKDYDKSIDYYKRASFLKPEEGYPKSRIEQIENIKYGLTNSAPVTNDLPLLFAKCKKAIFMIIIEGNYTKSQGSGFIISEDGLAVSNYHVFEKSKKGTEKLVLDDKITLKVDTIIEKNKENDYIIFKIKNPDGIKFNFVSIAQKELNIGEPVFAIGNPQGLEKTLTKGIVSGYREVENKYIQTDAGITHGSSGGPLFNMFGEVIGITSMGVETTSANLNFAVNIKLLHLSKYLGK
jgi:serine protease Do